MPQAKITLIGMENYLNPDHSVFEQIILPEGIDKDTLIGSIILRCQEFELLYSDPDFMTAAVNVWSRKNYWTFDKWVKLLSKQYDPLYNKDYYEDITDEYSGDYSKESSGSVSGSSSETSDYSRIDNLKTEEDTTVTHSEAAYNVSQGLEEKTEDVTDGELNHTGTQRNAGTTAVSSSGTNSDDESGEDSHTNTHTYHGYGNIGITSAQELFLKEVDVARFNMYEHIADLFCNEFCIMVY